MKDLKYVSNEEIARLIDDYASKNAIPEGMKAVYDYLHERHIKWANKIKTRQDEYQR